MPIELKIPSVGESISEVQISEWLKAEGDRVKQDEAVAVIDSEKTTLDLPAPAAGVLTKILHKAGETVAVGTVVAHMETGGVPAETKEAAKTSAPAKAPAKPEKAEPAAEAKPKAEPKEVRPVKPAAVQFTGEREEEVVPMTMLRRTVARRLVEAKQTMAMLTTFNEVDVSAVMTLRKQHGEIFEKRYSVRLGFMSFFVKAAIDALKQYPKINAEIRDTSIVYRNYFDVAVAIATERGLVVPVLRGAERMSFAEIEKNIGDFAQRSRDGKLQPEELEGGTFTITNGGVFGSLFSTPIINPPQSGILGMHTIQERPVAVAGQVVIRPMMYLALTYDHRLVDGREAVLFLRRVKETIENPTRMLIEI